MNTGGREREEGGEDGGATWEGKGEGGRRARDGGERRADVLSGGATAGAPLDAVGTGRSWRWPECASAISADNCEMTSKGWRKGDRGWKSLQSVERQRVSRNGEGMGETGADAIDCALGGTGARIRVARLT